MITAFLECLRPKQWTKNLLLFAGVIFAKRFTDPESLGLALAGFVVFCALSGTVYVFNDILDVEADRQHPRKRSRPIASGRIAPMAAGVGGAALGTAALGVSWAFLQPTFAILATVYLALTFAYSVKLKNVAILDILVLAIGFVLRALAGVEVIQTSPDDPLPVTSFFLLTTLFLALFLAIGKRRSELLSLGDSASHHRPVLGDYSREYLDVALTVATTGTIFSYALWTTQGQLGGAAQGAAGSLGEQAYLMVLTIPFVLYGVFRYLWLVYQREEGGAPEVLLLKDKPILISVVLWAGTVVAVLARGT